jgi:hypothetical protein
MMYDSAMKHFALPIIFLTAGASADNQLQVLGMSKTHIAIREITSGNDCCGADPTIDCQYPGVKELAAQSSPIVDPDTGKRVQIRALGVSIYFISYHSDEWTKEIFDEGKPDKTVRHFSIYQPVDQKSKCTKQVVAEANLNDAKSFAKKVGIDFELSEKIVSETVYDQSLRLKDCAKESVKNCDNPFYRIKTIGPHGVDGFQVTWKLFPIKRPMIKLFSTNSRSALQPVIRYRIPNLDYEFYLLMEQKTGIAGLWQAPHFLAHKL